MADFIWRGQNIETAGQCADAAIAAVATGEALSFAIAYRHNVGHDIAKSNLGILSYFHDDPEGRAAEKHYRLVFEVLEAHGLPVEAVSSE